ERVPCTRARLGAWNDTTHAASPVCCSGSLSLCDSNPRTYRGCIRLKTYVLRDLLPPIPPVAILPTSILPQQVDPLVGPPRFQAVDGFIAHHRLAAERDIEVDLTAEEAETALRGDPFLHQRIAGVLLYRAQPPGDRHTVLLGEPCHGRAPV